MHPQRHPFVILTDYFIMVFLPQIYLTQIICPYSIVSVCRSSVTFLLTLRMPQSQHSKFSLSVPYIFWTSLTFSPGSLESVGLYILTTIRLVAWILPSGDFFLWSCSCSLSFVYGVMRLTETHTVLS